MDKNERFPKARIEDLDFIKQKIVENLPVKYIYLFGSHAYGQPHSESDIDLYVVLHECDDKMIDLYTKMNMIFSENKIWDVDVLMNTEKVFKQRVIDFNLEEIVFTKGKII